MAQDIFDQHRCTIAAGLERVGDRWSILILRECFFGTTHFDQFEKRLGIAPNILTRRLKILVQEGLLVRREYHKRPQRFEYVLTERGRDFRPVLITLLVWGNRHFAPEGVKLQLVDSTNGRVVEPLLVDRLSGQALDHRNRLSLRANDDDETVSAPTVIGPNSELATEPSIPSATFPATHLISKE